MTSPIPHTVDAWLEAEQIDRESYLAVMRPWIAQAYGHDGADSPIHLLERGECANEEFERLLAERLVSLDGLPVLADGLLKRMFAATILDSAMQDLMRALRRAGLRTALLSNSWGRDDYPRQLFPELFDAVVISAEVFIDDIEANVLAAQAAGLVGLHHREFGPTAEQLSELLGVPLS